MLTGCHSNTYHARIDGYTGFYGRRATVPARQTQRHAVKMNAFRVRFAPRFPGRAVHTRVRGCFKNLCNGKVGYITGNHTLYVHVGRALPVGRTEPRLFVVPHVRRRRGAAGGVDATTEPRSRIARGSIAVCIFGRNEVKKHYF
jgi:hypothetical protein